MRISDWSSDVCSSDLDGRSVPGVTLTNGNGISATIIALGATLQSVVMPDRDGKKADVALGYDNLSDYIDQPQYFGSTVGRFANRLAGGRFKLDGKTWQRSEEHKSELQSLMRIS